jgi:hypothetical protein
MENIREILDFVSDNYPTARWCFTTPEIKKNISTDENIKDLPVVPGINSYKLFDFDIISHPLIPENTLGFADEKGEFKCWIENCNN